MNYRHLYHAGGFADAHKHAILALLLGRLSEKATAIAVLDTHAGIGRYDLTSAAAQRTGEFRQGIGRLLAAAKAPASTQPYIAAVKAMNPDGGLRWYPGSPSLAATLTRPQDRLVLMELHAEDALALKRAFAGDSRIAVHHEDGYLGLKAFLPPKERRGLVLIDPAFEATDEFERQAEAVVTAHRRWPAGIHALWYPIKEPAAVRRLHDVLRQSGIRKIMLAELLVRAAGASEGLHGSGLIVINPPWKLEEALGELLPWLAATLAQGPGAEGSWRWLVPE